MTQLRMRDVFRMPRTIIEIKPGVFIEPFMDLFWQKVTKTDGCWLWTGTKGNKLGHGKMSVHDHPYWVHVISYALHHGPVPSGKEVCHTCDIAACVRPDHLFVGTHRENLADMRRKGRGANPPIKSGVEHHMVSLTDQQVAEIRASKSPQRSVALEFGCSQSTVWRLRQGITRAEQAR